MLTIDEINTLTKNWLKGDFDNFIHHCFKDGKTESRYRMEADRLRSKHLERLNLAYVNTDEPYHPVITLTDKGMELRDSLTALEDSPELRRANLNLRLHRLGMCCDKNSLPVDFLITLATSDRSKRVRIKAATKLMKKGDVLMAGKLVELAGSPDRDVRLAAAPYAPPSLYADETDVDVIRAVIKAGRADETCYRKWTSSEEPFEIRLEAGELVHDEKEVERMLADMDEKEQVTFLGRYDRFNTGERSARLCMSVDPTLEWSATRIPDEYLEQAAKDKLGNWGFKTRMESYYDAYRKVLEMEVLFSGSDSRMLRKIRACAEADYRKSRQKQAN